MEEIKQNRQILSALCHGAGLASCTFVDLAIPIAVLCVSEDKVVQANAKEAINFHINLYIWWVVTIVLCLMLVGLLLLPFMFLVSLIPPIIGLVKVLTKPDSVYHYPFVYRFF